MKEESYKKISKSINNIQKNAREQPFYGNQRQSKGVNWLQTDITQVPNKGCKSSDIYNKRNESVPMNCIALKNQ